MWLRSRVRSAKEIEAKRTEKFPYSPCNEIGINFSLARTRTERRARGERAGAHAEARGERRGNVAKEIAAAGAMAVHAERSGGIGAEPVTAGFALRIDALHGETGQVLHFLSLSGRKAQVDSEASVLRRHPNKSRAPPAGQNHSRKKTIKNPTKKMTRLVPPRKTAPGRQLDGGDCGASGLWCQEERLQDIVVRLRRSSDRQIPTADLRKMGHANQAAGADRQGNPEYTRYVLRVVVVRLDSFADEPQTEKKCQQQQDSNWAADCRRCRT
jgi:hypothetical protein